MKSTDTFHAAPWQHNCAQAVANRWRHLYSGDTDTLVEQLKACGGGRAPGGLCGALYSATLAHPDRADVITEAFRSRCGAICCRDLKGAGRVACTACLDAADAILDAMS